MVKAVFFDLDDTLYDTTLQVDAARKNAVEVMVAAGLKASAEEASKALAKVVAEKGPNYQHHYDDMLKALGLEADPKVVAAGVVAYHNTKIEYLVPYADTIPTLRSLRNMGYRLGVVTDGVPVKQWEKLIRLGLMDSFHTVVIATEAEEQKPSPKPFKKAADNLNLKPAECLMVGDRLKKDVLGAKRAGMKTAQLVWGQHPITRPSGEEEEPDYMIPNLSDLLGIIGTVE
jgi:putative hydrolase of the HAD superfamily